MARFTLTREPIDGAALRRGLVSPAAGGVVIFEGVVRDHHEGRAVLGLEYHAYEPLAAREGERILEVASLRWPLLAAAGCHRLGKLAIGEVAVWIGVAAAHRQEAFAACAFVMDEVKVRVPVWKQESFADGAVEWSHGSPIRDSPSR